MFKYQMRIFLKVCSNSCYGRVLMVEQPLMKRGSGREKEREREREGGREGEREELV
jgi:hypothetical protein